MKRSTLSGQLLAWVIATLIAVWAAFAAVGYYVGAEEAIEISDAHLAGVAQMMLEDPPATRPYVDEYPTVVLRRRLGRRRPRGPAPRAGAAAALRCGRGLPHRRTRRPAEGLARLLALVERRPRLKVAVLTDAGLRDDLAWDVAGDIAEPGLWLLPVAVLVLGLVVRRGLRPLRALSSEVHALDVRQPAPLTTGRQHEELHTVAAAIDTLGARYGTALQREQQLASELAHELRTPLTSIALQANALRQTLGDDERDAALRRLEQDALRAGNVLSALLALARTGRTELAESTQRVDLCDLARQVTAEYAQAALDSGHDLGLSADGALPIDGHPVLLDLALRNLIDNALGHTARGTRVEVQVNAAERWLQVCDDGQALGDAGGQGPNAHTLGLGLGHRVVDKVAAVHQAQFAAVDPPPGFVRCYRIQWGRAADALSP